MPKLQKIDAEMLKEPAEQGTGRAADCGFAVFIFNSSLCANAVTRLQEEITDPDQLTLAVKKELVSAGRFPPEIASRIAKVLVFKEPRE